MRKLLSIIEVGGYQNFNGLYESLGFAVEEQYQMRKVLKYLKKNRPDVIVAEFNYQSDFRDRTSSLESMMSVVERNADIQVIVFYDTEFIHQLARLEARFKFAATIPFPIDENELKKVLTEI